MITKDNFKDTLKCLQFRANKTSEDVDIYTPVQVQITQPIEINI